MQSTWGRARISVEAIARKTKWYLGLDIDPETELTVTLRFQPKE